MPGRSTAPRGSPEEGCGLGQAELTQLLESGQNGRAGKGAASGDGFRGRYSAPRPATQRSTYSWAPRRASLSMLAKSWARGVAAVEERHSAAGRPPRVSSERS